MQRVCSWEFRYDERFLVQLDMFGQLLLYISELEDHTRFVKLMEQYYYSDICHNCLLSMRILILIILFLIPLFLQFIEFDFVILQL